MFKRQAEVCAGIEYSLLATCKINAINPEEWLTDVLNRINDCKMNDPSRRLLDEWMKSRRV